MKRKLYICPSVRALDLGTEAECLTAVSETVSGYNLQGDEAEYARTEFGWSGTTGGSVLDEENLW